MRKDAKRCSLHTEWHFKDAALLRKRCGAQVKHLLFWDAKRGQFQNPKFQKVPAGSVRGVCVCVHSGLGPECK